MAIGEIDFLLYGFECISPQRTQRAQSFKSLLKRRWTQIFAKGNNDKIKNYSFLICVHLRSSAFYQINTTLWNSVLLCGEFCSFRSDSSHLPFPTSSSFPLLKITINTLILIFFTTCLFTLIFSSPLHVTIRLKRVF